MPDIRPFRALRYDPEVVGDMGAVVAPPYDVVGADRHSELLERHPLNAIRLDLPEAVSGEDPDERYRRVARTVTTWRSDGTLRKDPRPSVYVYEQAYRVPGTEEERTQRGFMARLRIEPFGPGSSVLPHQRTLAGRREDRYRLLRATGLNTSPVVGLYEDRGRDAQAVLGAIVRATPAVDVMNAGVRHRLWVVPDEGEGSPAARLTGAAAAGDVVIADGHHRYEAAVRYRDERRVNHTGEQDPAFDYLPMLFLDAADQITMLPTHRILLGLGEEGAARLVARLPELFTVEATTGRSLAERFPAAARQRDGDGRFGLVTRSGAWLLEARRDAIAALAGAGAGAAVRAPDVTLLGTALEALAGIDASALEAGGRAAYATSAAEAIDRVSAGTDGADAAVLLEPAPVASILDAARGGELLPPASTSLHPRALTGLLFNPHEW